MGFSDTSYSAGASASSFGGGGLAGLSLISGISGAFSSYMQAKAQRKLDEAAYDINTRMNNLIADDAMRRSYEAEAKVRKSTKETIGAQRAALAAQGISVDSGSARDVQTETANVGELDALTIRNNAAREALGYKTQGIGLSMEDFGSKLKYQAGVNNSMSTLLTGGMQAAEYGQKYGWKW